MDSLPGRHILRDLLIEIVENRNLLRYKVFRRLEIFYSIYYFIRIILSSINLYHEIKIFGINFDNDPQQKFLKSELHPDLVLIFNLIVGFLPLFIFVMENMFYFTDVNMLSFQMPYDLIVKNYKQINACLRSEKTRKIILIKKFEKNRKKLTKFQWLPEYLIQWFCWQKTRFQFHFDIDQIDKRKLEKYHLKSVPNISIRCRWLLYKANIIIDFINYQFYLGLGNEKNNWIKLKYSFFSISVPVLTINNSYYLYKMFTLFQFNLVGIFFTVLDMFCGIYFSYKMLHCEILLAIMPIVVGIYQIYTSNAIYKRLKIIRLQLRKYSILDQLTLATVHHILHAHTRLCIYHAQTSKEFWSSYLSIYLILSIPFNVLMVNALMRGKGLFMQLCILTFLIIHVTLTLFPCFAAARQSKGLHRIKSTLVPIIRAINSRTHLSLKLKYSDLFNRLTRGGKYGQNVAIIGVMTFRLIYEV